MLSLADLQFEWGDRSNRPPSGTHVRTPKGKNITEGLLISGNSIIVVMSSAQVNDFFTRLSVVQESRHFTLSWKSSESEGDLRYYQDVI